MNQPTQPNLLILVFCYCIICFSCQMHITKRRYNPGYHIEITNHRKVGPTNITRETFTKEKIQIAPGKTEKIPSKFVIDQKNQTELFPVIVHSREKKIFHTDCDRIYLSNGKMILGTYIQMTDKIFTYKNCGGKSTDVESIDLKKLKFVVLERGDTIFPKIEAERWIKEHGPTQGQKGEVKKMQRSKTSAAILYGILGAILLLGGIFLLYGGISIVSGWFGVIIFAFLGIIGGALLIIGGIVLIVMAIVTAARN